MNTLSIRKSLQEYIRFADEKKVKALYTIVEEEINKNHTLWTKEFASEMKQRTADIATNKVKGKSRQSVQKKAQAILKNGK